MLWRIWDDCSSCSLCITILVSIVTYPNWHLGGEGWKWVQVRLCRMQRWWLPLQQDFTLLNTVLRAVFADYGAFSTDSYATYAHTQCPPNPEEWDCDCSILIFITSNCSFQLLFFILHILWISKPVGHWEVWLHEIMWEFIIRKPYLETLSAMANLLVQYSFTCFL